MKILKLISVILCMAILVSAFAACSPSDVTPDIEQPTDDPVTPPVDGEEVNNTYYDSKFVSFVSYKNETKNSCQITPYHSLGAKFAVTSGYLEQVNAFCTGDGDINFTIYKWDESYEKTVAGEPIKEKTFLKDDLVKYNTGAGMYNMELTFEENEVGAGTYLYVLSAVEGSENYMTVFTGKPWLTKQMDDEYKTYELQTFRNGTVDTSVVAQSSFVFSAQVEGTAPEKLPVPAEQDEAGTAKVIILAGQSNAEGVSLTKALRANVGDEKYLEYMNGYENVQIMYENLAGANNSLEFVNAAARQGTSMGHFGPELGLAEYLATNYPDEKFFIIKYAKGGSELEGEWFKASTSTPGSLLEGLIDFTNKGLQKIEAMGLTPKIVGFAWNQGETDSIWLPLSSRYYANQEGLVNYIRETFADYASAKGIAFIDAGILGGVWNAYRNVNLQKYQFSLTSPINFFIDISDLGFTTLKDNDDVSHYDADCMITLGHLYGAEIAKVLG